MVLRGTAQPARPAATVEMRPGVSVTPACRVPHILVMDDEEMLRNVIEYMLTSIGCHATSVADGKEAIAAYREAQARKIPFDLVILDLHVSSGIDGTETMKHLVAHDPDVKAVLTSGDIFDASMTQYRQFGFQRILPKPFTRDDLKQVVSALAPLDSRPL
jgi:two-component system, cell cycle sensor histidine kinase and response regulator CckA